MEPEEQRPGLTIVVGRPGSGKTTLARKLAEEIRCPLISRDTIKEGLVNTTGDKGGPGSSISRDACETFFAVLELLLSRRVSVVAEAFFPRDLWEAEIGALRDSAKIRMIVCEAGAELATERIMRRPSEDAHWERLHLKPVDQAKRPVENYVPPDAGVPSLTVDCSDGYEPSFGEILRFAMRV